MAKKKPTLVVPPAPPPTVQLPPRGGTASAGPTQSPVRRPARGTIDDIIARIHRRDALDETAAITTATQLYNSTGESFPLLSFMEAWKADKLEAPSWFVLAVIKAYGLLVQRHGGKPGE